MLNESTLYKQWNKRELAPRTWEQKVARKLFSIFSIALKRHTTVILEVIDTRQAHIKQGVRALVYLKKRWNGRSQTINVSCFAIRPRRQFLASLITAMLHPFKRWFLSWNVLISTTWSLENSQHSQKLLHCKCKQRQVTEGDDNNVNFI